MEVHMTLVDDLQELSRADLQDLCRTHDVTVNLNGDKRALALAAVEQLVSEAIMLWWVSRELDGAMIDHAAAVAGGMRRS
jgi:hypothetical protein